MTTENHTTQRLVLTELNDQAAQLGQAVAHFAAEYRGFMNQLAETLRSYFEAASRFDWPGFIQRFDAGVKRQIEAGLTLASKGWTIPGWIHLSELVELSQMKDSEIDDYFTAAYSQKTTLNDCKRYRYRS